MLNNIAIGLKVTLDLQTRMLTRVRDGKSVSLPASACLCLQALTEARGDVLSQEQLMDIGWRRAGVEVTENSVRVMVNKLRRALNTLELQDSVTLLAVTRSGYRLILRDGITPKAIPALSQPAHFPDSVDNPVLTHNPGAEPPRPVRRPWKRLTLALGAGIIAGLITGLTFYSAFVISPDKVDFVPWTGPDMPANTEIMVQKSKRDQESFITSTLKLYQELVVPTLPAGNLPKVLYITVGSKLDQNHLGLIACQQPFQDSDNECESFYFRVY